MRLEISNIARGPAGYDGGDVGGGFDDYDGAKFAADDGDPGRDSWLDDAGGRQHPAAELASRPPATVPSTHKNKIIRIEYPPSEVYPNREENLLHEEEHKVSSVHARPAAWLALQVMARRSALAAV